MFTVGDFGVFMRSPLDSVSSNSGLNQTKDQRYRRLHEGIDYFLRPPIFYDSELVMVAVSATAPGTQGTVKPKVAPGPSLAIPHSFPL